MPQFETLQWNRRLQAWRREGGSATTQLLDRVLAAGAAAPREEVERALRRTDVDERALVRRLWLEVHVGARVEEVAAERLLGIERHVEWLDGPTGPLGVVGGRPLRAVERGSSGTPAVRLRDGDEEVLLPFERLRLCGDPPRDPRP